jgi:hypothetical protein
MLEALISSRIRRALFEYILAHPAERFYLRGLAKSLGLSVSPLRRELKRLEQSGMLRAAQEGNMLFYMVNTEAPAFLQLQQAGQPAFAEASAGRHTKAPSPSEPLLEAGGSPAPVQTGVIGGPGRLEAVAIAVAPSPAVRSWRAPLPTGALIGAAGVGAALLVVVASLLYVRLTHRELLSGTSRALATHKAAVVIVPRETSSGVMRGSRWQISPGGFGGFSSGSGASANSEAF